MHVRHAIRFLLRRPLLSISVVLSLALGAGLNAAVFSIVDTLLLHAVPGVRDAHRLVVVYGQAGKNTAYLPVSYPNYRDLAQRTRAMAGLAAFQSLGVGLLGPAGVEQLGTEMVTPNYFTLLGVRPALGRFFTAGENLAPGAGPVAVLGYRLWLRRFGGDPRVIGRTILINRSPFTVVGVAPDGFRGVNAFLAAEIWVPAMMYKAVFPFPDLFEKRSEETVQVLGLLRPRVSLAEGLRDLKGVAAGLAREFPAEDRDESVQLVPLEQATIHPAARPSFVRASALLGFVTAVLLLLACSNVANLLAGAASAREPEIVLRGCLGAGSGAIFRQILTENLLLFTAGGALGLAVAYFSRRLLWTLKPPFLDDNLLPPVLDLRLLSFAFAATLAVAFLFGVLPAWRSSRRRLADLARRAPRRLRAGGRLVGFQVALCSICLIVAGYAVENLVRASAVDLGFKTNHLLMVGFDLRSQGYDEPAGRRFQQELLRRVAALPGVASAALAETRLLGGALMGHKLLPAEREDPKGSLAVLSNTVSPEYFGTSGIRILRGRSFTPADCERCPPVAIVNERLAAKLWPGRSGVGQRLRLDDSAAALEVVGVAATIKYSDASETPRAYLYLPLAQRYTPRLSLLAGTTTRANALSLPLAAEIRRLDPLFLTSPVRSIEETIDRTLWLPRLTAWLFALFGCVALLVAGTGIYGVTAHLVQRRRQEIAVRVALGARGPVLLRLVGRRGAAITLLGLVAGLSAIPFAGRLAGAPLGDPLIVALVVALISVTSVAANLVPMLRALRNDPAQDLKPR